MFSYIGAHLCELNTNPANKVAHIMRLTFARLCACRTVYMNKLEYVCLCWRLFGKNKRQDTNSLKCLIILSLGHTRAYDHAATCVRPATW